ncbi:hypothetical protein A2W24_03220 [Microgenomates group bacterium RBG_16_45_19]|nr:MAG: hypothetical protein A2W24_03220 [Microgenomates group bacterium RBG_16_45_19]
MTIKTLIFIFTVSLFLTGCSRLNQSLNPTLSQEELANQVEVPAVESSGDPLQDQDAIEAELDDLDAQADFAPFSTTDLTE